MLYSGERERIGRSKPKWLREQPRRTKKVKTTEGRQARIARRNASLWMLLEGRSR
jgi:hypothetical protein